MGKKSAFKTMKLLADFILNATADAAAVPGDAAVVPGLGDGLSVQGFTTLIAFIVHSGSAAKLHLLKPSIRTWIALKLRDDAEKQALKEFLLQLRKSCVEDYLGINDAYVSALEVLQLRKPCVEDYLVINDAYVSALEEESSSRELEIKRLKVMSDRVYIASLEDDRRKYQELRRAICSLPHVANVLHETA